MEILEKHITNYGEFSRIGPKFKPISIRSIIIPGIEILKQYWETDTVYGILKILLLHNTYTHTPDYPRRPPEILL